MAVLETFERGLAAVSHHDGTRVVTASLDKSAACGCGRLATVAGPQGHRFGLGCSLQSKWPAGCDIVAGPHARLLDSEQRHKSSSSQRPQQLSSDAKVQPPDGMRVVTGPTTKRHILDAETWGGNSLAEWARGGCGSWPSVSGMQRLITGPGSTALIWNAKTGEELVKLRGPCRLDHAARPSHRNGKQSSAASDDHTARTGMPRAAM